MSKEVADNVEDALVELIIGNVHKVGQVAHEIQWKTLVMKMLGHDPKVVAHLRNVVGRDQERIDKYVLESNVKP